MSEKLPTYEEFETKVREYYMELCSKQDQKRVRDYFESDESKEVIGWGYESNKTSFMEGEINVLQFLSAGGGAGATAYNLYMLCQVNIQEAALFGQPLPISTTEQIGESYHEQEPDASAV